VAQVPANGETPGEAPEPADLGSGPVVFKPGDYDLIAEIAKGVPARLKGVVKSMQIPKNSKCIYVEFESAKGGRQIKIMYAHKKSNQQAKRIMEGMRHLIGSPVLVEGRVHRHNGTTDPQYIRIDRTSQIRVEN
jgi:hypothetical protein